jgi:hypothetical protein
MLASCQGNNRNTTLDPIQKLPNFTLLSTDSSRKLNSMEIPVGKICILEYIDPECEHCRRQTKFLANSFKNRQDILLLITTNANSKEIIELKKTIQPINDSIIQFWHDYQYSFYRAFLPPTVPYLVIYGRNKELIHFHSGEVDSTSKFLHAL